MEGIEKILFDLKSLFMNDESLAKSVINLPDDESKISTLRMIKDEEKLLQALKQDVFENQRYYSRIGALLSEEGIKELLSSGVITDGYTIVSLLSQISDDATKLEYVKLLKDNKKVANWLITFIKDVEKQRIARYYNFSRNIGKDDQEFLKLVKKYVITSLKEYELFGKVFGENFAKERMNRLEHVFIEKPTEEYQGFCIPGSNIIAVTFVDYEKIDFHSILHESIHHILSRKNGIIPLNYAPLIEDTGMMTFNGIGQGLNEGLTEWICEKVEESTNTNRNRRKVLSNDAYFVLTNFIKQIELAIGEEKTLSLGMGGLEDNIPNCLGLKKEQALALIKQADAYYSICQKINDLDRDTSDYKESLERYTEARDRVRCEFESSLYVTYFQREFENARRRGFLTKKEFIKYSALLQLMQSYNSKLTKYPSNNFQQKFCELIKSTKTFLSENDEAKKIEDSSSNQFQQERREQDLNLGEI